MLFATLFKASEPEPNLKPESPDLEDDRQFFEFQSVLREELQSISERRSAHNRPTPAIWQDADPNKTGAARRPLYEVFGVALSGGGIRSAAFCLGALQSLGVNSLFEKVDYLSTVSGGGYVGASISAAMSLPNANGKPTPFPFCQLNRVDDNPALAHLRDYSNYILPRGRRSLGDAIAIVLRGLTANFVFIIAFALIFCSAFIAAYPTADALLDGSLVPRLLALTGLHVDAALGNYPFALTLGLSILLLFYMAAWAVMHSFSSTSSDDIRGNAIVAGRWMLIALLACALIDLQPVAVWLLVWIKANGWSSLIKTITLVTAPFATVVTFFSGRMATFLKSTSHQAGRTVFAARVASVATIWAASVIVPLCLWLFFLWLCACGTSYSGFELPLAISRAVMELSSFTGGSIALVYLVAGLILLAITTLFEPNANSLHQLYRGKLSKAFLFNPALRIPPEDKGPDAEDLVPPDPPIKVSDLRRPHCGPYHLINAAVNLQNSVRANRRGRNANFFLFSPKYVGSTVTGYAPTRMVEIVDDRIDLATAMAISGAAVSSNMGSLVALRPLAPTLALLNFRLGYWMPNPLYLQARTKNWSALLGQLRNKLRLQRIWKGYLLREIFGWLNEKSPSIYVTDGGHIENLGLYQLLKRHCSVVLVVDGEADPDLTFQALATCERYARIDLGVRIALPWQDVAAAGKAATDCAIQGNPIPRKREPSGKGGPHCAVGIIQYPGGQEGLLIYLKASVTGDEPDYVIDYKRRNPVFPHESTGDQFFSEEQFEAYRALGFHALDGMLNDATDVVCNPVVQAAAKNANKSVGQYIKSKLPP